MPRITNLDHIINAENRTRAMMILYDFICKNDFDELTESQKHFYFIQELENAINMDGFYLYFWNSRGDFAAETLQSLTAIGAFRTRAILQKAIDQFPSGQVPKEWASRQRLVEQIEETASGPWDALGQEFLQYKDDLMQLNIDYIKRNSSQF